LKERESSAMVASEPQESHPRAGRSLVRWEEWRAEAFPSTVDRAALTRAGSGGLIRAFLCQNPKLKIVHWTEEGQKADGFVLSYYPGRLVLGHKSLWSWAGIHATVPDFLSLFSAAASRFLEHAR
jgi:hypothetical protein